MNFWLANAAVELAAAASSPAAVAEPTMTEFCIECFSINRRLSSVLNFWLANAAVELAAAASSPAAVAEPTTLDSVLTLLV